MKDDVNEGFSSNFADLVRWATVAHRHRMGNLVWVGWCPGKKPSHLGKGSHLIMLSRQGFWHLRNGFDDKEIARGHIDLVLKAWLSTGNTAQRI